MKSRLCEHCRRKVCGKLTALEGHESPNVPSDFGANMDRCSYGSGRAARSYLGALIIAPSAPLRPGRLLMFEAWGRGCAFALQ